MHYEDLKTRVLWESRLPCSTIVGIVIIDILLCTSVNCICNKYNIIANKIEEEEEKREEIIEQQ